MRNGFCSLMSDPLWLFSLHFSRSVSFLQHNPDECQPFSDCPFPNPPGSFHCNGLSSFQKPLMLVYKRITRQQPLFFCTPCHPCRVRGQVLIAQGHQPLPTERSMHPFDALRSPRVPLLVSQRGRYAISDSLRLSYFPRWIFSWHISQTGICFRFSIRRIRLKPVACRL